MLEVGQRSMFSVKFAQGKQGLWGAMSHGAMAKVLFEPHREKSAASVPLEPLRLERPPSWNEVSRRVLWLASLRARFGDAEISAYSARHLGAACLPDPFFGSTKDWRRRAASFLDGLQASMLMKESMHGPVAVEPGIYYQVVQEPPTPPHAEPPCCRCRPRLGDEPGIGPCHHAYPNGVQLCRFGPAACKYCHHPSHFEDRLLPPTRRGRKKANHL